MEYKLDTPNREELVQTQTRVALFALETAFGALNSLTCKAPENTDINVRDAMQQIRAAQRNVAFLASHLTTTDHYSVLGDFIAGRTRRTSWRRTRSRSSKGRCRSDPQRPLRRRYYVKGGFTLAVPG